MTRVGLLGANGRMGTHVRALIAKMNDAELAAAIVRPGSGCIGDNAGGVPFSALSEESFADCDVVIDFSFPDALMSALPHLRKRPLVTGTTGLSETHLQSLNRYIAQAPVLIASNFSTGVTLLLHLARTAAAALPEYDVEIVEAHHRHKRDAPSGTALSLAKAVADGRGQALDDVGRYGRHGHSDERPVGEIGIHALRGGEIIGEHTVWLVGTQERIELGHVAQSRAVFAEGALRAAIWLADRSPGRYEMRDVLGL